MTSARRRWQSIDYRLPLLTSGLVLLTALVLGTMAYVLAERALIDTAGRRLFSTASYVAQMVTRPNARVMDSTTQQMVKTLRAFALGTESRAAALKAITPAKVGRDTQRVHVALLDSRGQELIGYHKPPDRESPWATSAIERGEITGDTLSLGPIESAGAIPTITTIRPVRSKDGGFAPVIGYIVESRLIVGSGAAQIRKIIGEGVELLVGQPGSGVWTDLEHVAAAPPVRSTVDTVVVSEGIVGAYARVAGSSWMVWLSQPTPTLVAPARHLLWSLVPLGILIAGLGALLMWLVTRRITHPIVELTAAAENIASDNGANGMQPTVLLPPAADEVSRLRYAFERMARRVSERQTLELQLRHSQKMEAVGRLAGGIAHDFNNLLTAIRSYSDLMLEDMPQWDSKRGDVLEIRAAAQRAAGLTAQLLAYSRKQMLQPKVLDLAQVLKDTERMLTRLMIEDVQVALNIPDGLWRVKADRGQLEQVIVNLAVNARDAMPHGGMLTISALNEVIRQSVTTREGDIPAGEYVAISVTDTGVGMDTQTQMRVFEPFFTTKPMGSGTGLGLATVQGIVAQSGGYITVHSAPQRGTTFTVYLPRVVEAPTADRSSGGHTIQQGHQEVVLVVEDEQSVRALARRVLTRAGYQVLESASPSDALRLAEMHATKIDLVLSDVVMPEMSGPQLVSKISEIVPKARVLFISGYATEEVIGRGLASPGTMLLQKPFSAQELVERVRVALDQSLELKT